MYLLSLIMPIYNAEDYLEIAINSIINQSIGFENIELILIDDCSTDNSKKIIERFARKYDNIIPFYSNENHGHPGFGRNTGLMKSTSDYIMFMDNDDELDKDFCKRLYETMIHENADVVCCDTLLIDHVSEIKNNIPYPNGIKKNNYIIIEDDDIILFKNISVWNKIFKKSIIQENHIFFDENTYADDLIFTLSYFLKSKRLIYLKDYFGYMWKVRTSSLSGSVKKEHITELIGTYNYLADIFKKENKFHLVKDILKDHTGFLLLQCSYLNETKLETKKVLKEVHDYEIKNNIKKLNSPLMNFINYFILHEHYNIARILFKITDIVRKFDILRKINRKLNN